MSTPNPVVTKAADSVSKAIEKPVLTFGEALMKGLTSICDGMSRQPELYIAVSVGVPASVIGPVQAVDYVHLCWEYELVSDSLREQLSSPAAAAAAGQRQLLRCRFCTDTLRPRLDLSCPSEDH